MDGNNRWSKKNSINLSKTYKIGVKQLLKITEYCFKKHNITTISAFALSTHNLKRSPRVISPILKLLDFYLDDFIINNSKYNFNIRFIGNLDFFNKDIKKKLNTVNSVKKNDKNLLIALNYSGSQDIIKASSLLIKNNNHKNKINNFLYTSGYPNPDILIRTGGFQRLSDFFLIQLAFTELFFTKTLWPDIKLKTIDTIINKYLKIERKFGK